MVSGHQWIDTFASFPKLGPAFLRSESEAFPLRLCVPACEASVAFLAFQVVNEGPESKLCSTRSSFAEFLAGAIMDYGLSPTRC